MLSKYYFYTLLSAPSGELESKIEIEHLINDNKVTDGVIAVLKYDGHEYKGFGDDYF